MNRIAATATVIALTVLSATACNGSGTKDNSDTVATPSATLPSTAPAESSTKIDISQDTLRWVIKNHPENYPCLDEKEVYTPQDTIPTANVVTTLKDDLTVDSGNPQLHLKLKKIPSTGGTMLSVTADKGTAIFGVYAVVPEAEWSWNDLDGTPSMSRDGVVSYSFNISRTAERVTIVATDPKAGCKSEKLPFDWNELLERQPIGLS